MKIENFVEISERYWDIINDKIITVFFPSTIILWYIFLVIQLLHSLINQDYSMYPVYIQVNLTLFGFTLLGSIFGSLDKKEIDTNKRKRLFRLNLTFLSIRLGILRGLKPKV